MKRWTFALLAVAAAFATQALARRYPTKPVHVIISFTPGSSTDIVGRIVMHKVSEIWGQPVVPENRAGAGGSIGSAAVAKAAPDGYTLLINSNAHSVNPAIYAKLPYDTLKDFTDVVPLASQPNVLVVNAGAAYKTLMDLVKEAKSKPGAINWGHAGIGSGTHLNTEKFVAAADIKVTQVPFKGTPEVVQAMFSGSVDCYWVPISAGLPHIKSGKLRALAVSTAKRNPTLPDVQPVGLHVDHREIGIDAVDAARPGQRIAAALDDLALARLGEVLHHDQHLFRAHGEIHRTAHRRYGIGAAGVPVGEVAGDRNLERAQHREVEMHAADPGERVCRGE